MGDKYQGFNNQPETLLQGAVGAATVTPSDSTIINTTRALWIGGTGNVALTFQDGSEVTLNAVPVGILDVRVTQVKSTGTTATDIVALY
jgi:T5SS/PEP-CTERM-associated repeat protein